MAGRYLTQQFRGSVPKGLYSVLVTNLEAVNYHKLQFKVTGLVDNASNVSLLLQHSDEGITWTDFPVPLTSAQDVKPGAETEFTRNFTKDFFRLLGTSANNAQVEGAILIEDVHALTLDYNAVLSCANGCEVSGLET